MCVHLQNTHKIFTSKRLKLLYDNYLMCSANVYYFNGLSATVAVVAASVATTVEYSSYYLHLHLGQA